MSAPLSPISRLTALAVFCASVTACETLPSMPTPLNQGAEYRLIAQRLVTPGTTELAPTTLQQLGRATSSQHNILTFWRGPDFSRFHCTLGAAQAGPFGDPLVTLSQAGVEPELLLPAFDRVCSTWGSMAFTDFSLRQSLVLLDADEIQVYAQRLGVPGERMLRFTQEHEAGHALYDTILLTPDVRGNRTAAVDQARETLSDALSLCRTAGNPGSSLSLDETLRFRRLAPLGDTVLDPSAPHAVSGALEQMVTSEFLQQCAATPEAAPRLTLSQFARTFAAAAP